MVSKEFTFSDSPADTDLLHFLSESNSYPHEPAEVQHIQTHISHVYVAPPYVYKIKKPVDLEFLDFSTLEKRKYFCGRELELNRRLCSEIYLGVVPIYRNKNGYTFEDTGGGPVEYAVKMKKMDERFFLSEIIRHSTLSLRQLDRIADKLAKFYDRQQPDDAIAKWGKPENIKTNTDENFYQTEEFINEIIDKLDYEAIRRYTNAFLSEHTELFTQRIEEGRMVDGHGDLHLEHVHLTEKGVCIYDCIEFNDRFRYLDLANDIAFLAMDLDFQGLMRQGSYLVESLRSKLEDESLSDIIDFYKCYRAYVRAKVKSMESSESEVSGGQRKEAAATARNYYRLALRYALIGTGPVVLIFMGRIASGKSTLAETMSERLGLVHYNSDRVRKALFNLDIYDRTPDEIRDQIYTPKVNAKTYSVLYDRMDEQLNRRQSVILDATFNRKESRRKLIDRLNSRNISYLFIQTTAEEKVLKERLAKRDKHDKSVSDARLEDFEKLKERFREPDELSGEELIRVNTDHTLDATVKNLYEQLIQRNLAMNA